MTSLAGKTAVIAGAGGELGEAIVHRFQAEGVSLVVAGDVSKQAIEGLMSRPASGRILALQADVTSQEDLDHLVGTALDETGKLDIMVNNAGVLNANGRLADLAEEEWRRVFDVNLMGAVHGIKSAVRAMRTSGGGSIINTGSVAGLTAWSHTGPYGASKAAVIHLTKIAAIENAPYNIRVNCVCPGTFPTAIHSALPKEVLNRLAERHPLGLGRPDQISAAYAYLASDSALWTTGSILTVDGGYSAL